MPAAVEGRVERGLRAPYEAQADIDHVWRQYRREGGEALRTRLIVHYMKTHVRRLAERLHGSLPNQVELDDLIQQGYLGLAEAIERFDIDRDVRFETFSARRIFGAMRDYLRAIDPLSRLARARAKLIDAATERHQKQHGLPPSDHELRRSLHVSVEQFARLMLDRRVPAVVSYQAAAGGDAAGESDAMDNLADRRRPTPLSEAEKSDLRRWITQGLSRRDHLIIILYYFEHLTMREVGSSLGISESRVSQRLELILGRLRSRLWYQGAEQEFV